MGIVPSLSEQQSNEEFRYDRILIILVSQPIK